MTAHPKNLYEMLHIQAEECGKRMAFSFLDGDGAILSQIDYFSLERKTKAIAAAIADSKTKTKRALVIFPPGLEYISAFFGCMYADIMAIPVYPPFSERTALRIMAIFDNAGADLILTNSTVISALRKLKFAKMLAKIPGIKNIFGDMLKKFDNDLPNWGKTTWINIDEVKIAMADQWQIPQIVEDDIAFLQYTSGSTGKPKGVMLSHKNIVTNIRRSNEALAMDKNTVSLSWLPTYHDMGLGVIFITILNGAQAYLYSAMDFLQAPQKWMKMISQTKATFCAAPNFAYNLCVRKYDKIDFEFDLSNWKIALNAAEPLQVEDMEKFIEIFSRHGFNRETFTPAYGMAECTVATSFQPPDQPFITAASPENPKKQCVGCGFPIGDHKLLVVDPEKRMEKPPGQVGEIWFMGESIGKGYWQRPQETAETYQGFLANGDGPYLRTGDYGFIRDRQIFISGRIKDIIIIRGRNYYPQDIEIVVENVSAHFRKGCTAAFALEIGGTESLVVVQEVKDLAMDYRKVLLETKVEIMQNFSISPHELILISPRNISKTTSGKIQRRATRERYQQGKLDIIAKWSGSNYEKPVITRISEGSPKAKKHLALGQKGIYRWLVQDLSKIVGIAEDMITMDKTPAELGLDSVTAVELIGKIESEMEITFPISHIFSDHLTMGQIAQKIYRQKNRHVTSTRFISKTQVPITDISFEPRKQNFIHDIPEISEQDPLFHQMVNPFIAKLLKDLGMAKTFVKGQGNILTDDKGIDYLDFIAQYGALPFGYNPPQIWQAMHQVEQNLEPSFVQPSILNAAGELAKRLLRWAPGLSFAFFANSGTEAVEAAIKLCRSSSRRAGILSTKGGFHGKTYGALSATAQDKYQKDFYAPMEKFHAISYGNSDELEITLATNPDYYAAFIVEPIQGEGGIVVPPKDYLQKVLEICHKYNVLLIVDEVQTGLGRTGAMFKCIEQGIVPDVITVAKALGGGLLPIGACLCRKEVYNKDFATRHSSTFAGNTLACRTAIAVLDLLEQDDCAILKQVRDNGAYLREQLEKLQQKYRKLIREVRGEGFMLGIDLAVDFYSWKENLLSSLAGQGLFSMLLCSYLLHHEKVRLAPALNGSHVIRVQPSLNTDYEQCRQFIENLDRAFAQICNGNTASLIAHLLDKPTETTTIYKVSESVTNVTRRLVPSSPLQNFAFIMHPLTLQSLIDMDPNLRQLQRKQLQSLSRKLRSHAEPFLAGETFIESPAGETASGVFIAIPYLAEELQRLPREYGVEIVELAIEQVLKHNPQIIGLGSFTSIVTEGGLALHTQFLPTVTSGNSFTAISGEIAVVKTLAQQAISPDQARIAIVGAAGSVGSAAALLLSMQAKQLVLVGNPDHHQKSIFKLKKILEIIVGQVRLFPEKPVSYGTVFQKTRELIEQNFSDKDIVESLLKREKVIVTTSLTERTAQIDAVLLATSSVDDLLGEKSLKKQCIICDLSRPVNTDAANLDDYVYIEGGIIEMPGKPYIGFNLGLPHGCLYACMAETVLLTLESRFDLPLIGHNIDLGVLDQIKSIAKRHEFKVIHGLPNREHRS